MLTIQKYEVDNTSIEKFSRLMPKFFDKVEKNTQVTNTQI